MKSRESCSNDETDIKNKSKQKAEDSKQKCTDLNQNNLKDSQPLALKQTNLCSNSSSMNDCLDPNESKKSNESNSIAPISLDNKKESINPENGSSSLEKEGKEGKEGDILNNIISVPTKIYEDSEEEKKR